jgi:hypothetical protein
MIDTKRPAFAFSIASRAASLMYTVLSIDPSLYGMDAARSTASGEIGVGVGAGEVADDDAAAHLIRWLNRLR